MSVVPQVSREAFVREWIKDLRSGKYKQGEGALKKYENSEYRYCCLGVACATSMRLGLITDEEQKSPSIPDRWFYELMAFYDASNNFVKVNGIDSSLVAHNDHFGHTFEQIADGLEAMFLTAKTP